MNELMAQEEVQEEKKRPKLKSWHLFALSGLIFVVIAAVAIVFRESLTDVQEYGYLGAFIISVMSAATIIVYVPGVPVIFTLGGVLPYPIFVGLAGGFGEAIGELTAYYAGWSGRNILKGRFTRVYNRIERWIRTRGYLTVFLSSAVFNPVFDIIGMTAGAMRFPVWKFFLLCWAGKTIKSTAVAYAGYWGLGTILRWLDIGI
jgi:uncharacterized membrane protein YdjX (TVP38/TMEM64 family)